MSRLIKKYILFLRKGKILIITKFSGRPNHSCRILYFLCETTCYFMSEIDLFI